MPSSTLSALLLVGVVLAAPGLISNYNIGGLLSRAEQKNYCGSGPAPEEFHVLHAEVGKATALERLVVPVSVVIYTSSQSKEKFDVGISIINDQLEIVNHGFETTNTSFVLEEVTWIVDDVWAKGDDLVNLQIDNYRGNAGKLNLHIVESVNSLPNTYGQCSLPPTQDFPFDGCVLSARTIPDAPGHTDNQQFQGKGLIHLLGHWFGLDHTTLGGCKQSQAVAGDVPLSLPTSGCPVGADTCPDASGQDPIRNFMGFNSEDCKSEFTTGQALRMRKHWQTYRASGRPLKRLALPRLVPVNLGGYLPFYDVDPSNSLAVETLCSPDRKGVIRVADEKRCGSEWSPVMKLNALAAAASAALLAGIAHADEDQKPLNTPDELPKFTPTTLKAPFLEQFTTGWDKRWKPSHAKKDMKDAAKDGEDWAYVGEWAVEEPHKYKGMDGDEGLVVKNQAAHHAISAKFPTKIDNKGKTLVVQYEVKLQNGLECGGAYMKLLRDNKALHQDEFSNTTPYVIMFGPDKCGHTNKVHFIINHKNPKTGEYEEKHLSSPPTAKIVKTTELYTLIVHPNNSYAIKQNREEVKSGSLLEDFLPEINPPAEIDDPKDTKPDDWVDKARIPDPEAKKPEDWDEDAPYEIVDEDATMPEDWLEKEPVTVPDPEAQKPEDWNDDEDGDWEAPSVPNPKCSDVSGCGPWTKPMKKNPDHKGKWTAPYIDNPDYKGPWAPRKIKNPDFFEDKTPANLEPMGAIGFEIWTMQNDILFDNIYIGHSIADADKLAAETWAIKHPAETKQADADKPKDEDKPHSPSDLKFLDDPVVYVKEKLDLFMTIARTDPLEAVKFVPEVAGSIAAVALTMILLVVSLVSKGASSPAVQKAATEAKDKAKEVKDAAVEATATGAEKAKAEVTKRTTRSQS
ncbi:hypothetical protein L249_6835 [Ophiocordyceps polyrhachis-furcata BCC 54312]|uniref:Peptidase M43 pregnancy-associated plasma-A domain-containing protein n=1 Tax=Ophiocordyceps polyrhachis-furcata BCC 54312 TaxID=1330021 RepID=A0A367LK18_9HYPO|nr:hypothetical protein L249_6835 [Ophiocordyceps polyrhachis-furcata BCC 54312]